MSVGKNIYELRIAKNLSQGDLAEILDVSRQSVSKWETDAAIPDLDKLMKMCNVFDVTLDELTGRAAKGKDEIKTVAVIERKAEWEHTKIVGYVLLATSLLATVLLFAFSDDIDFPYFVFPILVSAFICSTVCLCVKDNVGYWCIWAALFPVCFLSFHIVNLPFLSVMFGVQIIVCIVMAIVAGKKFANCVVQTSFLRSFLLVVGWLIVIAAYVVTIIFVPMGWISMCIVNATVYSIIALTLTYSVCYIKTIKRNKCHDEIKTHDSQ